MKPLRMRSWFLLTGALLAGTLTSTPADAKVVVSFTGTVFNVVGFEASPPSEVSVGNQVSGLITYVPGAATEVVSGPSERQYLFPTGGPHQFTLTIESLVWTVDLLYANTVDELSQGLSRDRLTFFGGTPTSTNFPGGLEGGGGSLLVEFYDAEAPFTLLNGYDLPDAPEDIAFDAPGSYRLGELWWDSNSSDAYWLIQFTLDSPSLPVETSTWGEVKALFARP